ncbi:MAG: DUF1836 domain-containing protein [Coriobacteriia bacterium]|nr:DUF1836 domain-containing protein [Coriobacteriia bacterium]
MTKKTFAPSQDLQNLLEFRCPRFAELPDMGLYLEQTLEVINRALEPVLAEPLTKPMMSNYVKKGVVPAPVKKRYYRDHLCYAIAMALMKSVFTVDQVAGLYAVQQSTYPLQVAYDFLCAEYENALHEAFAFTGQPLPTVETRLTEQTVLVRAMVLAATNHVFVTHALRQ